MAHTSSHRFTAPFCSPSGFIIFNCVCFYLLFILVLFVSLQKFYKDKYNREKGKSSYTNMKMLPQVEHAMEVTKNQSEVNIYHHIVYM